MPSLATMTRTLLLFASLGLALACSGNGTADRGKPDAAAPLVECSSYERELRACFAAVGSPSSAADSLARTLSKSDDATRLQMESACATNRARLRASCK